MGAMKMTKDELVPEIHDILKLCKNTGLPGAEEKVSPHSYPHLVYNYNKIENSTWEGICKHHHGNDFEIFPDSPSLFLLDMADSLAASTSRVKIPNIGTNDVIFKLWKNYSENVKNTSPYFRPLNLNEILEFVRKSPKKEDYFKAYHDYLIQRAEDAKLGANITSLYTHSVLTGKFYRILKAAGYSISDDLLKDKKTLVRAYNDKGQNWTLNVVKYQIKFAQKPFRVKDLNIFNILQNLRDELEEKWNDFVLFTTYNEFLLVLPPKTNNDFLRSFLFKYGFWFEFVRKTYKLKDPDPNTKNLNPTIEKLNPDPEKLKKDAKLAIEKKKNDQKKSLVSQLSQIPEERRKEIRKNIKKGYEKTLNDLERNWEIKIEKEKNNGSFEEGNEYRELLSEIKPPICEICQMAPAECTRIDDKSGIKEELCKYCWKIQEKGERHTKLAKWTYEEDIKTAWVKISLNFDKLIVALGELYIEYLKDLKIPDPEEKVEIRFSVLSEFQFDYKSFLKQLNKKIVSEFNEENIEKILDDFFCIKIDNLSEIIKILRLYNSFIDDLFPKFKETTESPIKLVISESPVKFPFFEHWKYLENPKNDVDIKLIGKGEMEIKLSKLEDLLHLKLGDKAALHKLAKIAETSKELVYMEIVSKEGKRNHPDLQKAIFSNGFEISDILTYIKIKSG